MLGYQKVEVCVFSLLLLIFIAMAVDSNDSVGVLVDHSSLWIHAEGPYQVLVLLCLVDDLAFIELVGNVPEDFRGKLNPYSDINPIASGLYLQLPAHCLHPLASAAANTDDTLF